MWSREERLRRAFQKMSVRLKKGLTISLKNKKNLQFEQNVELTVLKLERIIYEFLKAVTKQNGQRRV